MSTESVHKSIGKPVADGPVLRRVRELVTPIASDLDLDVYDVEQRGGTLRVTLDTPAGSEGGVTLDKLALASRLVSRELDEHDPVPGRYTLEVTSPGLERSLRTTAHFQREVGKVIAVRLSDVGHDDRRVTGLLVSADEDAAVVRVDGPDGPEDRRIVYTQIDRARTVFEWGPQPKPGSKAGASKSGAARTPRRPRETKEHS
jgi:ribosome maturation factor RimP